MLRGADGVGCGVLRGLKRLPLTLSVMSDLVSELAERAKALSAEDRARLAEELLATLDPHDEDIEAAWDVEILKRIEEVENGTVKLVPAEEAFAQVRRALRQ